MIGREAHGFSRAVQASHKQDLTPEVLAPIRRWPTGLLME